MWSAFKGTGHFRDGDGGAIWRGDSEVGPVVPCCARNGLLLHLSPHVVRDRPHYSLQDGVVPVPHHAQVVVAVIKNVCQHLFSSPADSALGGGDGSMGPCLYGADGEEVQARLVDKPILGEGEEGPSIGEEGGVRVKGDGVKRSPLVS